MNWLKDTTQSYRRGFVEGESGDDRNCYLLEAGADDIEEYSQGYVDGLRKREENEADA